MTAALYDLARQGFLNKQIDWTNDVIKVVLGRSALYTVNLATHQFLSDVPALARAAVSGALAGKSSAAGIADANDLAFTTVPAGLLCDFLITFADTGVEATSRLISYQDGLSVTPNGMDINLLWDNDVAKRIFKL